jgi:hypothetical protein
VCVGNTSLALLRDRLAHLELGELLGVLNSELSGDVKSDSIDINRSRQERVVQSRALAVAHLSDDASAEGRIAELLVASKTEILQAPDLVREIELESVNTELELRGEGLVRDGRTLVEESTQTADNGVLPSNRRAEELQLEGFWLRVLAELRVGKGVAAIGEGGGAEAGHATVGEMSELIRADVVKLLRTSHDGEPHKLLLLTVHTRINGVIEREIRGGDEGSGVVGGRIHAGPMWRVPL